MKEVKDKKTGLPNSPMFTLAYIQYLCFIYSLQTNVIMNHSVNTIMLLPDTNKESLSKNIFFYKSILMSLLILETSYQNSNSVNLFHY